VKVEGLDHLVLTVKDLEATCAFYKKVLGLEVVTFGGGRKALACGAQQINLHQQGQELEPRAQHPTPGSADLCFLTATPLSEVIAHLAVCGVAIVAGPVRRTGARGPIESVYCRDPDLNLIEVANYEPLYQPSQATLME
jgi:catechol 2,3-dioxygenase-like lactoylglutathione lyase family enzyme